MCELEIEDACVALDPCLHDGVCISNIENNVSKYRCVLSVVCDLMRELLIISLP